MRLSLKRITRTWWWYRLREWAHDRTPMLMTRRGLKLHDHDVRRREEERWCRLLEEEKEKVERVLKHFRTLHVYPDWKRDYAEFCATVRVSKFLFTGTYNDDFWDYIAHQLEASLSKELRSLSFARVVQMRDEAVRRGELRW